MYEIVVRFRQREEVIETVDSLEIAWARVQVPEVDGLLPAHRPSRALNSTPGIEPLHAVAR